jgi:hypothetical protein
MPAEPDSADALRARQQEIEAMLAREGVDPERRGPISADDLIPRGEFRWMCAHLQNLITNSFAASQAAMAAGDFALANSYYQLATKLLEAFFEQCVPPPAVANV